MVIRGRLVEGIDWEFGIDVYTLLYLKQIINNDLNLPNPGIEPRSPEMQVDSLPLSHWGSPNKNLLYQFSSVQFSHPPMSESLWPYKSQNARPPCPLPTPGVHSNSCPASRWCHLAISSSVVPFSSCPQSFPASESFQWVNSSHEVDKVLEF